MADIAPVQIDLSANKPAAILAPTGPVALTHNGTTTFYATIQSAVNASVSGDAIAVAGGSYVEQVVVNGKNNLSFTFDTSAVLLAPLDVTQTATSISGRAVNALFTVINATNVTVSGGSINGAGHANTVDGPNANYVGVYYQNASGGLTTVNITGIRDPYDNGVLSGAQRGVGVQVDNAGPTDLPFFMHGGSISDFQKNATVFINANLDVSGVTITGNGNQPIIAQNGFQVGESSGTITNSTVTGIGYSGAATDTYSSSFLLYDNAGLNITGNNIVGANSGSDHTPRVIGIGVYSFGGAGASGGSITGNTIDYADIGIDIEQTAVNGLTVANNTITHSDLTDAYGGDLYIDGITGTGIASSSVAPLMGGNADDFISLGSANDYVESGAGNDVVFTGDGNDTVIGGSGAGDDFYDGGPGIDTLTYPSTTLGVFVDMNAIDRSSNATVAAILTNAALPTNTPVGIATGAEIGTDAFRNFENVTGGSGNDTIWGDAGANTIDGGGGNDVVRGGLGNDTLIGGAGIDTLDYSNNSTTVQVNLTSGQVNAGAGNLDAISGFEGAILSAFDDQFIGDGGANTVEGGAGNDQLDGRGGFDIAVYNGTVAADGLATQIFGTLQFNAGANGTDQLVNIELVRFQNPGDTLNITIDNGNAVVASRNDAAALTEGDVGVTRTVATGVLSNDVNLDQGGADQKFVFAVNGATTNVGQPIVGTYGTLTLFADGHYSYVANQAAVNVLSGGEIVTDVFSYQADDTDTGDSAPANLIFSITGVNDLPTLGGTNTASVTEDTGVVAGNLVASGTLTITDPDHNESTYRTQNNVEAAHGAFVLNANGAWTYTVNNGQLAVQQLGAGQSLTDSFTAVSLDGSASQTISVTINGTNDNPVIGAVTFAPASGLTETNTALSTAGTVAFSDVDLNDTPTAAYTAATGFAFNVVNGPTLTTAQQTALAGAFSVTSAGAFAFTTPSPDFLGHDDVLTLTYAVVVSDQHGGSATTPVTITINGTNDIPVITSTAQSATVIEAADPAHTALTASGAVTASDADNGDALTYALTGTGLSYAGAGSLSVAQSNAISNAFTINANGTWTYNLASPDFLPTGSVVTLTKTVQVSDGHGGTATQDVVLTIDGTNDAPTILPSGTSSVLVKEQGTGDVSPATAVNLDALFGLAANPDVTDATTVPHVSIQATANGHADYYSFTVGAGGGTVTLDTDFVDLAGSNDTTFALFRSDGTFIAGNDDSAPDGGSNLNSYLTANVAAGSYYVVVDSFPGVGNEAPGTISSLVAGGTYQLQVSVTNPITPTGTYNSAFTESDAALSTSGKVNFLDVDIADAPVASYTAATDASVTATGATLTAGQIAEIKAGFVLVNAAGNYTFNLASPNYLAAGDVVTAVYNVHVTDGHGGDTIQPITVTITGTNDAPVLTGASLGSITDTVVYNDFPALTGTIASVTDVDNHDTRAFTLNGSATSPYGVLTLNTNGSYSFEPNDAAINGLLTGSNPTVTYSVTVTDSGGLSSTANFTIAITGSNENPVLATSPLSFNTDDNSGTATFNFLTGASDPDVFPGSNDLDIASPVYTNYSTSGAFTAGQNALLSGAIASATGSLHFDNEAGTYSFNTNAFDFLDTGQSVTLNFSYTVADSNGGTTAQTASVTIGGALETNIEVGTPFDDVIDTAGSGFAGNGQFGDYVNAREGDDIVHTNAGADLVYAGEGDDFVDAGSGDDIVVGGVGDDEIYGGSGNDLLYGDEPMESGPSQRPASEGPVGFFALGDNHIDGGSGNDTIYGGLGNNVIVGGSGNDDIFIGSAGVLSGGTGNAPAKSLAVAPGSTVVDIATGINVVDGGSGFDTVHVSGQWSEYTITRTGNATYSFERPDGNGGVESNAYSNVEYFVFDGGAGTAAMLANDAPVVAPSTFAVPETADGGVTHDGRVVGNVGATDADTPLGDRLRYFIDGSGAEHFTIDETGTIHQVGNFDFEVGPRSYALQLTVLDSKGAAATTTVTINITDVNDPIRAVTVTGGLTTPELATTGTVVATAAAIDPDAASAVSYALTDNAGGRFAINATTGVITVANGNLLDFEQANSHSVTVQATSNDGSTSTSMVNIAVTDVSPETIVGTAAAETFVAGAGVDSYTTNITTSAADSVNLGAGLDRVTVNAAAAGQVRLTFTSAEVGNGAANDSNTLANQDGGLAVRLQAEDGSDGLTGPVTRTDDEGMIFIGGTGVTFDVRDLPSGVSRGNAFEVAVLGTNADDVLTAVQAARPYYFNAGAGNDSITGGTANDFLVGGSGDDVLAGGAGNNSYIGGAGIDTLSFAGATGNVFANMLGGSANNGYGGTDTFTTIENIVGGAGADTIIGSTGDNVIVGGLGADYLIGFDGNDTLDGGTGSPNSLEGGKGDDTYIVSAVGDSITENVGEGIDTVRTGLTSFTLAANVENLVFTGAAASTGIGNGLANTFTGGVGNDIFTGGAGADSFRAVFGGGLDRITDFTSGSDKVVLDTSFAHTASFAFVSGTGALTATTADSTFIYHSDTGILSYDADGNGAGAAVDLFNVGAGTVLVSSDIVFPLIP